MNQEFWYSMLLFAVVYLIVLWFVIRALDKEYETPEDLKAMARHEIEKRSKKRYVSYRDAVEQDFDTKILHGVQLKWPENKWPIMRKTFWLALVVSFFVSVLIEIFTDINF